MSDQTPQNAEGKLSEYLGDYSEEDIKVIENTVAKGCNRTEIAYFLKVAQTVGLNPFNKEIWCYKDGRGNQIVFAGRDGFLKAAQQRSDFGNLRSAPVYENDEFDIDLGISKLTHKPALKDRGKLIGAWAWTRRMNGEENAEFVRYEDRAKNSPVWKSYPGPMTEKDAQMSVLKKTYGLVLQNPNDFKVEDQVAKPAEPQIEEEPQEKKRTRVFIQEATDTAQLMEIPDEVLEKYPELKEEIHEKTQKLQNQDQ